MGDLTGLVFGRLTALHKKTGQGKAKWICICECGIESEVSRSNLISGHTKSCGCMKVEMQRKVSSDASTERLAWEREDNYSAGYKIRNLPPIAVLKERLSYDPYTGCLSWKSIRVRGSAKVGSAASHPDKRGRMVVHLKPFGRFMAHRVIWKMVTGSDPSQLIDHVDGNPSNNRWLNLREATPADNAKNIGIQKRNRSGFTGVTVNHRGKYEAKIGLGTFDSAEEAHAAYMRAALLFRGEFTSSRMAANDNRTDDQSAAA
ncbi:HNH endonuclease [Rhizobium sp. 16-449-1b]|uniref:HNH endonuclease n=1 Tax=Rhizobium sp. 16-449-1b TaxID=2819989 RepID=UPI001ADBD734|nr:HNH endonuclease [Rhizobium sp. 16-449-1b]MBO9194297.1 HNH endonuclease [Rhizobium sp. 16-449-1b]